MKPFTRLMKKMEEFQRESFRGYHVYKDTWDAALGEELQCQRETGNASDFYAVAVQKDGNIVGHLPRKISRVCTLFMRRGGDITCQVTGGRKYSSDLPQGGMEIPCILNFKGEPKEVKKLIKLLCKK